MVMPTSSFPHGLAESWDTCKLNQTPEMEGAFLTDLSNPDSRDFGLPTHYRPRQRSAVWERPPAEWRQKLASALERNLGSHSPAFFFRADDIGAGGRVFYALCELFRSHKTPLAMAVVPAWLTAARTEQLFCAAPLEEPLWGWHQHGWRHVNLQRTGGKSEFGEQRPIEKQWRDICQGIKKMTEVFGDRFIPVFTPPWNRLPTATLKILQELDFKAVSMTGFLPRLFKAGASFKNLRIQLDLHTRKAKDGHTDFLDLLDELSTSLTKREPVGIMLHHHRMTPFAFEFLDELLSLFRHKVQAHCLGFEELLENEYDE
jgi:hypothetical protein